MTIKPIIKAIAAMAVGGVMLSASANSVGLDAMEYDGTSGQVSITVNYNFMDNLMLGGGVDLIFDANALEFVSYTQAPLPDDADEGASSPLGEIFNPTNADGDVYQYPGSVLPNDDPEYSAYAGFGIGTFNFFVGMSSAGEIGTLVFNVLGSTDGASTPCGMTVCLVEARINPFTQIDGVEPGDVYGLLDGGQGANVLAAPIPVPAAVWFMLSGLGALLGFGRKSA